MKKIILFVIAFCLVGCAANETKNEDKKNSYCGDETSTSCKLEESADMSDYENFSDKENQFVKANADEILAVLEKKQDAVVYFGYPGCPWCVEALPVINDVAKEENINILYVQTRDAEKNYLLSDDQKTELMDATEKYLESDANGEKQLYVPFVIVIKDGKVVAGHIGTVDGYDTSERKMKDQEKRELKNIYSDMLKKLK